MPEWLCDLLVTFAGAFFGVLGGYGASRLLTWRSAEERRAVLIRVLKEQLRAVPSYRAGYPPFGPGDLYRQHHASAVGHLLQGDTLDAADHGLLIRRLTEFEGWTADANDSAAEANAGALARPATTHDRVAHVREVADASLRGLAASRDDLADGIDSHREASLARNI